MTSTAFVLRHHPSGSLLDASLVADAIDALVQCSSACTACADACLAEPDVVDLRSCIGLNLVCADICATTARTLAMRSGEDAQVTIRQVTACAQATLTCAERCRRHGEDHQHCAECARACHRASQACADILLAMQPPHSASA